MPGMRLTENDRSKIEVLFAQGLNAPEIARAIGRDRTTVWRELKRGNSFLGSWLNGEGSTSPRRRLTGRTQDVGVYDTVYCTRVAQEKARVRARLPKELKLTPPRRGWSGTPLWQLVCVKLRQRWSPRTISWWLAETFPERPELQVSHECIYQAIYLQGRGAFRRELQAQVALRTGRVARRPQGREAAVGRGHKPWIQGLHISTRPAEADDRAVPGHWEGDLLIGARGSSAIITLVERSTRFVMLGALPSSRVSEEVVGVLTELMGRLPAELGRTLAWDQGPEMAEHADFTLATDCKVFFCDPHSPWQRGSNENTNGLLRQYFPKGSADFRDWTQDQLDAVARELNGRPRPTLGWKNPAQALNDYLVAAVA